MNYKQRRGFTLIELLIVVAIIGILAVSLVPRISDAPARARDAARKAIVSSLVQAVESYNLDYGRYPDDDFCLGGQGANPDGNLIALLGGEAPSTTLVSSGTCKDEATNKTYPFYIKGNDSTSYTVGMSLETQSGNATCGDGPTADPEPNGTCFAVFRGNVAEE